MKWFIATLILGLSCLTVSGFIGSVQASQASNVDDIFIDFETIPGGTPAEGLVISTQYSATAGIIFSLEGGGFPVLADVGGNTTAFAGPPNNTGNDAPAPDQAIGGFFLTDDGMLSGLASLALIVSYNPPTAAASGVILDIDFDETFTIEARDQNGVVLQTITLVAGGPGTGDGVATLWSFERESNDVYSIRFQGTRTAAGSFGLGFDNFSARAKRQSVFLPLIHK
jgi:hypothetical protein